jgi:hypothetical protein
MNKPVIWYHCDFGNNKNQEWQLKEGKLHWLSGNDICASVVDKELVMTSCASASNFTLQSV